MKKIYKHINLFATSLCFMLAAKLCAQPIVLVPYGNGSGGPGGVYTNTINCGSNSILKDHSGFTGYNDDAYGYTVINAGFASQIIINGNYDTEGGFDYIEIYSGVGTGGTMLASYDGNGTISFTGSPGQTLTVLFYSDGSVTYTGFNLNITFSGPCSNVPCSGPPATNTVVAPLNVICPNTGFNLLSSVNYSNVGITYSWYYSTASNIGPFTAIPNATLSYYAVPSLSTSTWFRAVANCGVSSSTYVVAQVSVAATTTNSVPYFEGFEGSPSANNELPNCSWSRSSSICRTNMNGSALTGNGNGSFADDNCIGAANYFYSNGIQLLAGVTYSASVWHLGSIYSGSIRLAYGVSQTPSGLTTLASVNNPTNNNVYAPLSNTFQVSASGFYYIAIRASGVCGETLIDDLSVIIPCTNGLNSPNLAVNYSTLCEGQTTNLIASGANTYTWNSNGSNSSSITITPNYYVSYSVSGTNTLTGCTVTLAQQVSVTPLPVVAININSNAICLGSSIGMGASGAYSYTWSNGVSAPFISVTPTANATYTLFGTGINGCVGSVSQSITVNPLPNITVAGNITICPGSNANLTASGANTYTWSSNSFFLQGTAANPAPLSTNVCTVIGKDLNGCTSTYTFSLFVTEPCVGIVTNNAVLTNVLVYPNPNNGNFTIELNNGLVKYLDVMDVSGRLVLSSTNDLDVIHLNIQHLSNGIYYIKVKSNNAVNVLKIVKQ
jgi:hypothetical protein